MVLALHVVALILLALTMALPLAHALEFPGKRRLHKEAYLATQPIYYPGFTIAGFGEPASIAATLLLVFLTPPQTAEFWLTLAAGITLVTMHGAYWILTHPVNNFWLREHQLTGFSGGFFRLGSGRLKGDEADWIRLRDRWEYSHVVRAGLGLMSFVFLATAVAI